jgi:hypothetical protein
MTIPIMTILVSLMSDSLLSKFQKSAERFGVKGGEDKRYQKQKPESKKEAPRWRDRFRIFHRKKTKRKPSEDLEKGPPPLVGTSNDEILEEEILEEVQDIERHAEEGEDMGLENGRAASMSSETETMPSIHRRRSHKLPTQSRKSDEIEVNEEVVDRALKEERRKTYGEDI